MALSNLTNKLADSFERLSPREKIIVSAGSAVSFVIILSTGWLLLSRSVDKVELRSNAKRGQMKELVALQSTFATREAHSRRLKSRLKGNKLRLVSHVEAVAKKSGVEIGNMTPRESSPDPDGIKETTVVIKLQKLSITRLQDFLERLENTKQGIVKIKRLRMRKRYDDKSLLDVELSIATYKTS